MTIYINDISNIYTKNYISYLIMFFIMSSITSYYVTYYKTLFNRYSYCCKLNTNSKKVFCSSENKEDVL